MLAETEYAVTVATNGARPDISPPPAAPRATPMADEAPPEPVSPTPHHQSQAQLALLRRARTLRTELEGADEAFRLLMPNYGLTTAFLAEGMSRCDAADAAIAARRLATVAALEATERQAEAHRRARAIYSAFRRVARTVVSGAPGKLALGLDEAPPAGIGDFVQSAAVALRVAQDEPYASLLTAATFGPERVEEAQTSLQTLDAAMKTQHAAQAEARRATDRRDSAIEAVRLFVHQATVEIDTMVRQNPQLRAPAAR